MKINPNRKGLVIGALFTAISLMLVATVIAPALAVLPGYPVEKMVAGMATSASDHQVQLLTILVLAVIFLLILIPALLLIRSSTPPNEAIVSGKIILLMALLYMIVHPLVFHIFSYAKAWNRKDAQYLMAALVTVPFSSFAFVIVGAVIDAMKKRN